MVADARDFPWSVMGPSESDMVILADGKTVMAAIRMDADGPCADKPGQLYREYYQTYSTDYGCALAQPLPSLHWFRRSTD